MMRRKKQGEIESRKANIEILTKEVNLCQKAVDEKNGCIQFWIFKLIATTSKTLSGCDCSNLYIWVGSGFSL